MAAVAWLSDPPRRRAGSVLTHSPLLRLSLSLAFLQSYDEEISKTFLRSLSLSGIVSWKMRWREEGAFYETAA